MNETPYRNAILRRLSPDSILRLGLTAIDLPIAYPLETPGEPVERVFFLEQGICSVTTRFASGAEVEAAMFGFEAMSGTSAFLGSRESLNASYIQIAGSGYSCTIANAAAEFARGGKFQMLALRSVQVQFLQSMQSAGCNATHQVEQRLARWLLLCAERTKSETLQLSHEFMADMLGSRRSTVTIAAGKLKRAGLIKYVRGAIQILDHPGLEAVACECYAVLRDHLRRSLSDPVLGA